MVRFLFFLATVPFVSWWLLGKLLRKRFVSSLTAIDDLSLLGTARKDGKKIKGTAIVAGGSIAGLLAARVCADHFEKVVIIEPEEWVCSSEGVDTRGISQDVKPRKRARIPQYTSVHAYQAFTLMALKKMFPDFETELRRVGGDVVRAPLTVTWSGLSFARTKESAVPRSITVSRPRYETLLRSLVLRYCENVKFMAGSVFGVEGTNTASERKLNLVRIRSLDGNETKLAASLVVDCTGPVSSGFKWLKELPSDTNIPPSLDSLKTSYYAKASNHCYEFYIPDYVWKMLYDVDFPSNFKTDAFFYGILPDPRLDNRACLMCRTDNDILHLTVGGYALQEDPKTLQDLVTFFDSMRLHFPLPMWLISTVRILRDSNVPFIVHKDRFAPFHYIRYHESAEIPSNFVAVGDSILQLNPAKGQGCTKACVEAATLNTILHKSQGVTTPNRLGDEETVPPRFSKRYFALQRKRTGVLWDNFKYDDYVYKTTIPVKGDPEPEKLWSRAYMSRVLRLARSDSTVSTTFLQVSNWLAPSTDFFAPAIVLKVVCMWIGDALFGQPE